VCRDRARALPGDGSATVAVPGEMDSVPAPPPPGAFVLARTSLRMHTHTPRVTHVYASLSYTIVETGVASTNASLSQHSNFIRI
jgi:hypothetical protein